MPTSYLSSPGNSSTSLCSAGASLPFGTSCLRLCSIATLSSSFRTSNSCSLLIVSSSRLYGFRLSGSFSGTNFKSSSLSRPAISSCSSRKSSFACRMEALRTRAMCSASFCVIECVSTPSRTMPSNISSSRCSGVCSSAGRKSIWNLNNVSPNSDNISSGRPSSPAATCSGVSIVCIYPFSSTTPVNVTIPNSSGIASSKAAFNSGVYRSLPDTNIASFAAIISSSVITSSCSPSPAEEDFGRACPAASLRKSSKNKCVSRLFITTPYSLTSGSGNATSVSGISASTLYLLLLIRPLPSAARRSGIFSTSLR